jgi:hypothetical protein
MMKIEPRVIYLAIYESYSKWSFQITLRINYLILMFLLPSILHTECSRKPSLTV